MEGFIFILFLLGVVAFVAWIAHLNRLAKERRQREFAQLAQEKGWSFYPDGLDIHVDQSFFANLFQGMVDNDEDRFLKSFEHFRPFDVGHSRQIENLAAGRDGEADWYVFDYSYAVTTSNGKTTTTSTTNVSVVAVRVPIVLPALSMEPEGIFSKIVGAVGFRDLQFESAEFNDRYHVRAGDEKAAYGLIHPLMMEFLLKIPGRIWQLSGPLLVVHQPSSVDIMEYRRMIADVEEFLSLIPRYFVEDRGFQRTWAKPLDDMGLKNPIWDQPPGGYGSERKP